MGMRQVFDKIAPSWSARRTKPVSFVKEFLENKKGLLLVEGCGSGRHSAFASKQGLKVVGFDFSLEMVKLARKRDAQGFYVVADLRALPFKDKVFSNSLSIAVLNPLKQKEASTALKELKRVTKNKSLLSVWLHPELRGEALIPWSGQERFYYLYEHDEFKRLVSKVFKTIKHVPDEKNIVLVVS
jgi:ubiquinone/menaquinone biosynthesis C-methylase UbiE